MKQKSKFVEAMEAVFVLQMLCLGSFAVIGILNWVTK